MAAEGFAAIADDRGDICYGASLAVVRGGRQSRAELAATDPPGGKIKQSLNGAASGERY